jgi:phage gpG-like protein
MSSTNSAVGALVARNAAAGAPRRTGRLAASVRSSATNDRADITSSVVYAGVIHWGWPAHNIRSNPFATRAASATEPAWVDMYADQLDRILEGVRGI